MTKQPKGKIMISRGMVLYINRNTRTTKGYFLISEITEDKMALRIIKIKNILS